MYRAKQGFLCGAQWVEIGQPIPQGVDTRRIRQLIDQGVVESDDRPESADAPTEAPETADAPPPKPRPKGLSTKTAAGIVKGKKRLPPVPSPPPPPPKK